ARRHGRAAGGGRPRNARRRLIVWRQAAEAEQLSARWRDRMPAMKFVIAPALAVLMLTACATTPTFYAPAASPSAMGYSEYRIEPGRYRVTFRGGPGAPPQQVADYTLLRAADLALADGYDWFRITDRFGSASG